MWHIARFFCNGSKFRKGMNLKFTSQILKTAFKSAMIHASVHESTLLCMTQCILGHCYTGIWNNYEERMFALYEAPGAVK